MIVYAMTVPEGLTDRGDGLLFFETLEKAQIRRQGLLDEEGREPLTGYLKITAIHTPRVSTRKLLVRALNGRNWVKEELPRVPAYRG